MLDSLFSVAYSFFQNGDFIKAKKVFCELLEKYPQNKEALFYLALCYKYIGDYQKSIGCYENILEVYPDTIEALYNVACLYSDIGDMENSIKYYNKVLNINSDDVETKYFISIAYMKNRQYKEGLKYFENRLCRKSAVMTQEHTYPNLLKSAKLWQGEDIKDKVIYTYYEAGFGDVLMFARYLPLLREKCKKVIFKPQVELFEIFKENFPDIQLMKYFEPEKNIHFDYHIPVLSLPYVLGLDESNMFVSKNSYLRAMPDKAEEFGLKYFDNSNYKIGIKWQGNTMYDWERVIDVKEFKKLMMIPDTKFYSFQMGDGAEKINELEIEDMGKNLKNFSDTAAAIENLDLVICNDTSLAHVAGAMGKPCWVLLPYLYNWRWHQDLTKCDWYDSVKLFRQTSPRNWDDVFDVLFEELNKIIK